MRVVFAIGYRYKPDNIALYYPVCRRVSSEFLPGPQLLGVATGRSKAQIGRDHFKQHVGPALDVALSCLSGPQQRVYS